MILPIGMGGSARYAASINLYARSAFVGGNSRWNGLCKVTFGKIEAARQNGEADIPATNRWSDQ